MEWVGKDLKGHQKFSSTLRWANHSCSHLQECPRTGFCELLPVLDSQTQISQLYHGKIDIFLYISKSKNKEKKKLETAKYQLLCSEGGLVDRNSALPALHSGFGFPGSHSSWGQGAEEGPHLSVFIQLLNHGNMEWFGLGGTLKTI